MSTTVQEVQAFSVTYARERAQYVVRRGEVEVIPTPNAGDPLAERKARNLAVALNRVYAVEAEDGARYAFGADEHHYADGSPRPEAREWFEAQRAAALAKYGADVALPCDVCGQAMPHATPCEDARHDADD